MAFQGATPALHPLHVPPAGDVPPLVLAGQVRLLAVDKFTDVDAARWMGLLGFRLFEPLRSFESPVINPLFLFMKRIVL